MSSTMTDTDTKMEDSKEGRGDNNKNEEEEVTAQQIRVSFRLAPEYAALESNEEVSLAVPTEAIAVPGHLTRKALSTVVNHLLGRGEDDEDDEGDDEDEPSDKASPKLPVLDFEFLLGESSSQTNRRLLRTSLDKHVRQNGLSLEQAVIVTYFPCTPAPQETPKEGPPMPDWVSALSNTDSLVVSACYDGSIHVLQKEKNALKPLTATLNAHQAPIKCLDSLKQGADDARLWMASGSMDNTLALHTFADGEITCLATAQHAASVASVKFGRSSETQLQLASGDWDGGVFVWRFNPNDSDTRAMEVDGPSSKKRKGASSTREETKPHRLVPTISLQAHISKISGLSFGGRNNDDSLITASWDHAIKLWNLERQDCLMTINTSRVVSCLDTSPHSAGICVTGHPDCFLRLWDLRVSTTTSQEDTSKPSSLFVSQNTFQPSHKAWVSQVAWSRTNPYQVYSASHDGTVKVWDLRSSLPLHTVKVCSGGGGNNPDEKILALALASDAMFVGGTTKIVEQYQMPSPVVK